MESRDPDLELWQQAATGKDAGAFDRLRAKYSPLVRGEIRKRLPTLQKEDLDDLDQVIWTAVCTALPRFRGSSLFSTWLVGICKNVLFSWMRHQFAEQEAVVRVEFEEDMETTILSLSEEETILDRILVEDALGNLDENERMVIQSRYFAQLTDSEVASRLGMPLGTVKSRIRSGLHKLRVSLHTVEGGLETGRRAVEGSSVDGRKVDGSDVGRGKMSESKTDSSTVDRRTVRRDAGDLDADGLAIESEIQ